MNGRSRKVEGGARGGKRKNKIVVNDDDKCIPAMQLCFYI